MSAIAIHKSAFRASTWAGLAVVLTAGIVGTRSAEPVAVSTAAGTRPTSGAASPPAKLARRWYQLGKASWYGKYLQGHPTASGESYNMYDLTCAHRSLPIGSLVRVTNLRNRKSVVVRVNDRGPLPEDRIVDLSYAAASTLGVNGLAKVRLELLPAVSEWNWPTSPGR
jgi:rare lipoprotein A